MLNTYVFFCRLYFIYNYKLDCNLAPLVRAAISYASASRWALKSAFLFGSSLGSSNYIVAELTDVSPLREIGKNCIYGDKSLSETGKIIVRKIRYGDSINN